MSTSNFHCANARKIYVVAEDYEDDEFDEDGNETGGKYMREFDDIDFDDLICYLRDEIEAAAKGTIQFEYYEKRRSVEELRSYPTTYIGTLYIEKTIGDITLRATINAFIRGGYYSAANLDWELQFTVDGQDSDNDLENAIENFKSYSWTDMSEGLKAMQVKNLVKFYERSTELLIQTMEDVFTECSTPYGVTARFSNGETVYHKLQ